MKIKSQLAHRLIRRYFFTVTFICLALIVIPLGLKIVLGSRVWYQSDFLYPQLAFINQHLTFFLIVTIGLVWVILTYLILRQATSYLDETFAAAKQLVEEPTKKITLSSDLATFEGEMNQIRLTNLFHQQAAENAERKKNELIVYLAHDLRTPLTSIIGYLTLLEENPELAIKDRSKYTGIALEKAYRLESLINEFFEITRFNLSSVSLITHSTDLGVMTTQLSYEFLPLMAEKKLTWKQEIATGIWVELDTEKFARVLDNLIKNAINYADSNTPLQLSLHQKKQIACLRLTNIGATIPADKLKRIFEPFFRGDSARKSTSGGTGLGLSIAKEIIQNHQGTISATSSHHTFTIEVNLPLTSPPDFATKQS